MTSAAITTSSFPTNSTLPSNSTTPSTYSMSNAVAEAIDRYVPPCLFSIGLVCNTLVIIIMGTRYFANVSTSFYIRFNAVVDGISLATGLSAHWFYLNFPNIIYRGPNANIFCKFLNTIGWGTSDLGVALTVAMTFERTLAIKFPLHAPTLCTVKRAKLTTLGLIIIVLAKDWQFLIKSVNTPIETETHLCDLELDWEFFNSYFINVMPMIHNIFTLLSFLIIIICNVIIIKSVNESRDFHKNASDTSSTIATIAKSSQNTSNRRSRSSARKERQITIMLISDSITIIICTFPFALYIIIANSLEFANAGDRNLMFSIVFYLLYVNRCANFFLYCLSGERFRSALKELCSHSAGRDSSVYSGSRRLYASTQSLAQKGEHTSSQSVAQNGEHTSSQSLAQNGEHTSSQSLAQNGEALP